MINIGNVYAYCIEDISLIENYEEAISDKENMWLCHHRLETHDEDGNWLQLKDHITKKELIERGKYYHVPASELIFLKKREHQRIHRSSERLASGFHTERARKARSEAAKKVKKTPEWNKKNSEAAIKRHAFYIMLPDGKIMTTRDYVISLGLDPAVTYWFTTSFKKKNKCVHKGVTYYALPLGRSPTLPN